jgi:predicted nucleic acid-binding protein
MSVLVDSSVWIDYFRGTGDPSKLDFLIEENLVVVNELILAEIIPQLHVKRQNKLIGLLREVACPPLAIDWDDLIQLQITCLRKGINKVGLPDLMIVQHAIQHHLELYSLDKHFALLSKHIPLALH